MRTWTMRPPTSGAMAALKAKIRASWVRGRRSIAKRTSAPRITAARIDAAAMILQRNVCRCDVGAMLLRQPDEPEAKGGGASNREHYQEVHGEFIQEPCYSKQHAGKQGNPEADERADHPGGEVGAQNI